MQINNRLLPLLMISILIGCTSPRERQTEADIAAIDTSSVVSKGKSITEDAFQTLSSNLMGAMQEGGFEYALQFCKVEALPLTDSLSTHYNVQVRRATHRPRNASNSADSLEMETIRNYIAQLNTQEELTPVLYRSDDQIIYHAPIVINNGLCLNCHGDPGSDIQQERLEMIGELYPDDKATGFDMGELRGIWSVEFPVSYSNKETPVDNAQKHDANP